jgi:hypothetical protein
MKNLVHSVALICFIIWATGYLGYGQGGRFHLFLAVAIATAFVRMLMEKSTHH